MTTKSQQQTLTDRIDAALKATEGHSTGPWEMDDLFLRDATGLAVCRFDFQDEDGSHITPLFFEEDAPLIAAAPDLRALLTECMAELRAQAEALARVTNAALYAVVSETSQDYRFDGLHTQPEGAQQHQREVIAAEAGKLVMTDVYALVRVQKQEDTALGGWM